MIGLLLFWYLKIRQQHQNIFELYQDMNDMVEEVLDEVRGVVNENIVLALPLTACATILESSWAVWQSMNPTLIQTFLR